MGFRRRVGRFARRISILDMRASTGSKLACNITLAQVHHVRQEIDKQGYVYTLHVHLVMWARRDVILTCKL